MSTRRERPFLFLEIEGVLLLLGHHEFNEVNGVHTSHPTFAAGCRWLGDLEAAFELVWASAWKRSSDPPAPMLGPTPPPWLEFAGDSAPDESQKLAAVARYVGTRPFAWIDAEVDLAWLGWLRTLGEQPRLMITVDPRRGLDESTAETLLAFAGSATDGSWQESYRNAY